MGETILMEAGQERILKCIKGFCQYQQQKDNSLTFKRYEVHGSGNEIVNWNDNGQVVNLARLKYDGDKGLIEVCFEEGQDNNQSFLEGKIILKHLLSWINSAEED